MVLSESPLILLIPNFLSEKTLQAVKNYIETQTQDFRASVTEDEQGEVISTERRSKSLVPNPKEKFVSLIREKCAKLVETEVGTLEPLQVYDLICVSHRCLPRSSPTKKEIISTFIMMQVKSQTVMKSSGLEKRDILVFSW